MEEYFNEEMGEPNYINSVESSNVGQNKAIDEFDFSNSK